jgi:hypothetical protein
MENRSVFALDGITGMLIATVLLLSILAGLTVWGLGVQQGSATNFYQLQNEKEIKMISTENATHKIDVK